MGYLVSRYRSRRAYQQTYLATLQQRFGELAFDTVVPDLAAFEKAVTDRTLISVHSPSSSANSIAQRLFSEVESRAENLSPVSLTRSQAADCRRSAPLEPPASATGASTLTDANQADGYCVTASR